MRRLALATCLACALASASATRTTAFVPQLRDDDPALVAALCNSVARRISNATDASVEAITVPWSASPARVLHAAATGAMRMARAGRGSLHIKPRRVGDIVKGPEFACDADEDAWACMFGEPTPECPAVFPDTLERAELLWRDGSDRAMVSVAGAYARMLAPTLYHEPGWVVTADNEDAEASAPSERSVSMVALFGERGPSAGALADYEKQLEFVKNQYNITSLLLYSDDPWFVEALVAGGVASRVTYVDDAEAIWAEGDAPVVLTALWLLQQGSVFVGSMHSHVARAAYLLMTGRIGRAPPYLSVDGGGVLVRADSIESLVVSNSK